MTRSAEMGCRRCKQLFCVCPPGLAAIQYGNIDHLDAVRATLPGLPPEQRLWLFRAIAKGYCTACGEARDGVCHCENDE